jgi:DHA2 family multidrug resistance protein-like MFS transporter
MPHAFLRGVPVMFVLVVAGPMLRPEQRSAAGGLPDLVSVALSLGTILPVVYGIKTIANDGVSAGPITAIATGLVVGVAFLRRQATASRPLLDLKRRRNHTFASAMTVSVLGAVTMAASSTC